MASKSALLLVACCLSACVGAGESRTQVQPRVSPSIGRSLIPHVGDSVRIDSQGVFDVTASHGRLWVVGHSGRETFRSELFPVDPASGAVGKTVRLGTNAWNAIGIGETVWVTDNSGLRKVDPERSVIANDSPALAGVEIAFSSGGIWTAWGLRLSPSSGQPQARVEGVKGNEIASSDSAVWISNSNRGVVYEIDPVRNRLVSDIARPGYYADQLAYGDGELWVAWETDGAEISLTRVDVAAGTISEVAVISKRWELVATDMIVTEGFVWLLAYDDVRPARLYQFDAKTGSRVGRGLQLDGTQLSITATNDTLWIGDLDSSEVTRIDLRPCEGNECSS